MTNKEKFIEVFKQEPDSFQCPVYCSSGNGVDCPYYETYCEGNGKWWRQEYSEKS